MSRPQVMIEYSKDGGMTWSHQMWYDLVGDDKEYLNRIVLRCLGGGYNWVFRLRCSENISFTLVSAHADVSVGI